ncbi:MAG: SLC13 family permease [Parasphingopyxis sp.]|uniref:SLC13 family permease n=1 Tax=Parasphingopyxis sp. TaxID=1920299 RepID=UPI003F9FCCF1
MTAKQYGFFGGLALFVILLLLPPPEGMPVEAWRTAALVALMASWWMTEALPLTATALLPFVLLPFMGVMTTGEVAGAYYSPILFLILGGAFLALAIERTGLHRRLALAIIGRAGKTAWGLLFAFMASTAILSMIVSNTSTTLIMVPIAIAVLAAGGVAEGETKGFAGALLMGIAFSASIGGIGTLVGSPTNAIAAGLMNRAIGTEIDFLTWAMFGLPVVAIGIPLCLFILVRMQRVGRAAFDTAAAQAAIGDPGEWSEAEKRLMPVIMLVVAGWIALPFIKGFLPDGAIHDGTIAILGGLLLFVLPDGSGRPVLNWPEANRAPWDVIMLFGGGLALASGIMASGLGAWLGEALEPLQAVDVIIIALAVTALVVLVTEFASNVATASAVIPVVAALIVATGADPMLLAMPAAIAASWGFMLPSGTGPNAIAWASNHIALPSMLKSGFLLDICGIPMIVLVTWGVAALAG